MKKQVYKLGLVAFLGMSAMTFAQQDGTVGVNVDSPSATLEIQPSTANKVETATTNEGIIVPKLTKTRVANIADGSLVEGTLIYVTNKDYSGSNGKVAKITEKGFYYYDGNEWVKAGGSATKKEFTARLDQQLSPGYDWTDGGKGLADYYEFTSRNGTLVLPPPANYPGAIIHYKNSTGGTVTYAGSDGIETPSETSSITGSSAQIVWSDGNKWYLIGGRN